MEIIISLFNYLIPNDDSHPVTQLCHFLTDSHVASLSFCHRLFALMFFKPARLSSVGLLSHTIHVFEGTKSDECEQ